jgi:DNA polymerase delta subunit 1
MVHPIIDDLVATISKPKEERESAIFEASKIFSRALPDLEGDPIIQIGTTVHRYGSRDITERHIFTLGTCDDAEGINVVACKTERELLKKWGDMMSKLDPDIVTGYNIFGFDYNYLDLRAKELSCVRDLYRPLNRLCGRVCEMKTQKLSSSALGDNILIYVDMPGRVSLDLMKVVQRDHKLDSYKLDSVAEHFTGDRKHDVSPHEIFRLQRGDSADRCVVAKYCVQDCELVNKLVMKLEVLSNNIGMANVCYVPLSYIFMRGQGIKIFRWHFSKKYRQNSYARSS